MNELDVRDNHIEWSRPYRVMMFYCNTCGRYQGIMDAFCQHCGSDRPFKINREVELGCMGIEDKNYEKHAEFYNHEAVVVENMNLADLEQHISKLEEVAFEARARLSKSHEKRRFIIANLSQEQRDKLITKGDITITEAIGLPKVRKDRQTKADKLFESLAGLMSDEDARKLMGLVSETVESPTDKGFVFKKTKEQELAEDERKEAELVKSNGSKSEINLSTVQETSAVFDPSKLFGN